MWFATVCDWVCGECKLAGMRWLFVCCFILWTELLYPENLGNWETREAEEVGWRGASVVSIWCLSTIHTFCVAYLISLITRCGYYFFAFCCLFFSCTIWGQCLFPWEARRQQLAGIRLRMSNTVTTVRRCRYLRSFSVLLSTVETSHRTWRALVLAWWGWWLFEEIWYDVWDEECLIDWQQYTGNEIV